MVKHKVSIVHPEYHHQQFRVFCDEIEAHIAQPVKILKKDKVSYVCVVDFNGRPLVVKRSNIKGLIHAFRQTFRTSRAVRNCHNAKILKQQGILTFEPIAAIETSQNLLSGPSYLITNYIQGRAAVEIYGYHQKPNPSWEQYGQEIAALINKLGNAGIFHHDLNLSNIIMCDQEPALIDLDGLKMTRVPFLQKWYAKRERRRFLENFTEPPALSKPAHQLFLKLLSA